MSMDWHDLIQRHMAGLLDEDEAATLQGSLKSDPELRRLYLHYMNLDVALEAQASSANATRSLLMAPPAPARKHAFTRLSWRPLATAAAVVLAFVFLLRDGGKNSGTKAALLPRAFAMLVAANDALWADPNVELALRAGELPPGLLRLESGTAEFLCADGATVVMRGPATVRFPARKRVAVESGKVFCRCPSPESRLTIETIATEIVDLGTEFAVEARADRSTLVAVLSGEVQVGKSQPQLLRKGQSGVVRGDGILAIQPLAQEDFSELLLASPSVDEAVRNGRNLLGDPGFEAGLSDQTWSGTEPNLATAPENGRSGGAVRITSDGHAQWPQCRQKLTTGDIAGRLVVATVWAAPDGEALRPRQSAMLKIVFVNEQGRDFAFAMRRFLDTKSAPNRFGQAQVAAFAPAGTRQVQMQLMFQTHLSESGSILFDDAALIITDPAAAK